MNEADTKNSTLATPGASATGATRVADSVLIIGLDGATFDVLDPLMADGRMPNLKSIVDSGTAGVLESTKPPITPAAWTTFMTGKGPGRHGIIDFEKYDVRTNTLEFNHTQAILEKTIWEILSEKGIRVGSINLPMTYPPRAVNGFMISGFETPTIDSDFTYPPDLKDEILKRWPDYTYRTNWRRRVIGQRKVFAENMAHIERSFDQGCELAEFCTDRYGWDVMMVLFKLVDNLQHKAWRHLPAHGPARDPVRTKMVVRCFERLDETIGRLHDLARRRGATLLIMSDHGHGSLDGKAQPNLLLKQWGYLSLKSPVERAATRAGYLWYRAVKRKSSRFAVPNIPIERDLAVDWSGTRACVMHAGMYGFLYVTRKDRWSGGAVDPADYEGIRDDLIKRFSEVECNHPKRGRCKVFPEVHRPEELYNCSRQENEWMPDLLLIPAEGLAVVRKIRGFKPVRWTSDRRMEGTHRVEGVLAAWGPHVREGHRLDAHIADIAPSVLASLGLPVPIDMEGRALTDLFDVPMTVEFEPPQKRERVEPDKQVYSAEEMETLTERLSDLGYLE
ncbi:MAG: alkaline phosphatase family protein [Phycisphaerae bacterium]|nr:alkaline phosphatase family protein [Phycisphaerae bacterium]